MCGLRGTGPALAGKLWRGWAFARCARGGFDRFQCSLRTDPAPLRFYGVTGGPVLRLQGSFGEDGLSRGARGEGLIAGPSLFSVVFKPAGFISFRTITDNWFLVTRRLPEDLLGRDPISERSGAADIGAFEDIALPRRYLGEAEFAEGP